MTYVFKVLTIVSTFVQFSHGFTTPPHGLSSPTPTKSSSLMAINQDEDGDSKVRELVRSLVEEENRFSSKSGSIAFRKACSSNCVYEDCYEPQPFVGREVCADFEKNHMLGLRYC